VIDEAQPFLWPDPPETAVTRALIGSSAAWGWYSRGFENGVFVGIGLGRAELVGELKDAGATLRGGPGWRAGAPSWREMEDRRRRYTTPARTADEIRRQACTSWGLTDEQGRQAS